MARKRFWLLLATLFVVVLSACGSDEGTSSDGTDAPDTTLASSDSDDGGSDATSAPETTATTAPAGNVETPAVTEMGSFSVNETEFAVTFLNRCIPFGGEDGQTIDLQPLAQGQGATLFLYGTRGLPRGDRPRQHRCRHAWQHCLFG